MIADTESLIELTPEKPDYNGGSWHIEGQLNERICASALYYYDSENISESFLAFRQKVDGEIEFKAYGQVRDRYKRATAGVCLPQNCK